MVALTSGWPQEEQESCTEGSVSPGKGSLVVSMEQASQNGDHSLLPCGNLELICLKFS